MPDSELEASAAAGPEVPASVEAVLRSPGRPLDAETRAEMGRGFGHDFGRVRVHADADADESARRVDALAYTVGQEVVFAAGRYAPGTAAGKRLLAHELAHVIQQERGASTGLAIGREHDGSERLADRAGRAVTQDGPAARSTAIAELPRVGVPMLQRQQPPSKTKFKSVEDEAAQKELEKRVAAHEKQGKKRGDAIFQAMDDMFAERVEATGGKRIPGSATPGAAGEATFLMVPEGLVYEGRPVKPDFYTAAIDDGAFNCHSFTFYGAKQSKLAALKKLAKKVPKEGGALAGKQYFEAGDLINNGIHFSAPPPNPLIFPRWVLDSEARVQLKAYVPLKPADPKVKGDIVVYSVGSDLPHSGQVIEVDKKGNPAKIKSKWGHQSIFEHAPDAVPTFYGSPTYYRKK